MILYNIAKFLSKSSGSNEKDKITLNNSFFDSKANNIRNPNHGIHRWVSQRSQIQQLNGNTPGY